MFGDVDDDDDDDGGGALLALPPPLAAVAFDLTSLLRTFLKAILARSWSIFLIISVLGRCTM
jgi:hypothetical protein